MAACGGIAALGELSSGKGETLSGWPDALCVRAKPAAAKGRYVRAVTVSSTMGPGVRVDPARAREVDEALATA